VLLYSFPIHSLYPYQKQESGLISLDGFYYLALPGTLHLWRVMPLFFKENFLKI
jgi:hypothetical protein